MIHRNLNRRTLCPVLKSLTLLETNMYFSNVVCSISSNLVLCGVGSINLVERCMFRAVFNSSLKSLSAESSMRKHWG